MIPAEKPANERARQRALDEYAVLDTPAERAYDDVVNLASFICRTPIALVSLVDRDRQWFKARTGLDAVETPRDIAFCSHAILNPGRLFVVQDAQADPRFADNPLVTANPNIRFYAGAPLVTPTGEAIGTLCVIDREPRELTADQASVMQSLARQVMAQLDLRRSIDSLEAVSFEREGYVAQLEEYQRHLENSQTQLRAEVTVDPLTGTRNRHAFDMSLREAVAQSRRLDLPLSVLSFDIDSFTSYNDNFGRDAGDTVLRGVAERVHHALRAYDVLARFAGGTFAVLAPATRRDVAAVLAERCRRAIQRASWSHRPITASFGVATLTDVMADGAELLGRAEMARNNAKRDGRNRVAQH